MNQIITKRIALSKTSPSIRNGIIMFKRCTNKQSREFTVDMCNREKSEKQNEQAKSQEDENLEFIIEQAYIKKKVEQAALSSQVKIALEKAKAKQRRKAHLVVAFGLFSAVAITLFVFYIHQTRSHSGVLTETTKDRKF